METCGECDGGGEVGKQLDVDFWRMWECEACGGTGEVERRAAQEEDE